MNITAIVCLFVFGMVAGLEIHPDDPHNHESFPSDEEFERRLYCVVGKGPCSDMMKDYLQKFPLALQQACANCNPEMKKYLQSIFGKLKESYFEDYKNVKLKFDPEGKYFDAFEAVIANA